jgi:large subunit ribosomal protein L4
MATVTVYNWDKKKVGEVELTPAVFEQAVTKELLHTVVRWQLACRRQGTVMTKTKGLVSGGGKKPFKQKGTGNARQGSSRSPLMPGGGTMFGPQPRDYSYSLPKKVRQAGLRHALSYLQAEGKLFVVEDMKSEGKTNELAKRLKKFGVAKAVLLDQDANDKFTQAAQNLVKFRYYGVEGINVYDLLKYDGAIITKASLGKILSRCGVEGKAGK